ncbi:MAG TPA: DUF1559 domain-containing protein [Pirellulales bacterium]|nr:DUF1559 domain-containing protein [Pirellulales bacterium]
MNARRIRQARTGMSLVEFMVVISVLGLILSLLLPAIQSARETGRRTRCLNNLRSQGQAILQFEQMHSRLPSAGEGTDITQNPPATALEMQSLYTKLLDYLEEDYTVEPMNFDLAYNDDAWPQNQTAAKTSIVPYLCPSNAIRIADPDRYGLTDYMPVVYTDIDPVTGIRNPATRMDGGFRLGGTPVAKVLDGMSRTVAIFEDAGRAFETIFPNTVSQYADPVFSGGSAPVWNGTSQVTYAQWCASKGMTSGGLPAGDTPTPSGRRVMNRWAEPACAGGISGQPNSTQGNWIDPINGNSLPTGGPPNCPWSQTNCGPNEEPWSWHQKGSNVLMFDGAARFIGSRIDPRVLRKLVTADEQEPYGDNLVPE